MLIDPAFEVTDEFSRMTDAVVKAYKKWPGGTYALWYPMKDVRAIRRMHGDFDEAGLRDVLTSTSTSARAARTPECSVRA